MKAATLFPESPAAPPKLFYRIHEVAQMLGLKPYVLRYWETEFKELAPAKDGSDQRRYRQSDVEVVRVIRKLLYEERYTIKGARLRLREELKKLRAQSKARPAAAAPPVKQAKTSGREQLVLPLPDFKPAGAVKLDRGLSRLRMEVNELINMLGA